MKKVKLLLSACAVIMLSVPVYAQSSPLPVWTEQQEVIFNGDWLLKPVMVSAGVYQSADRKDIILFNGLLKRSFRITPNVACFDFRNLSNGQQLLRSIKPEARITLDGKIYNIGSLHGQKENAYLLPEWLDKFNAGENDFMMVDYKVTAITPYLHWKHTTWTLNKKQATGKMLSFRYKSPLEALKGFEISVNYELYDGIPLIVKWISIKNNSGKIYKIDRVMTEVLGVVEEESAVEGTPEQIRKQHGIYVETNYAFNNAMRYDLSDQTLHWNVDSLYTSQVNYFYQTPCVLEVYPDKAPGIELHPGEAFHSVRAHELLIDTYERSRRGLILKKMYSTIAPWTTQNPIFMHLVSQNDQQVKVAVDQCAATGYEAVILSFGSHLDMEDSSEENTSRWKSLAGYAHNKGILLGGYSLFSSRRISDEDDVIDPATGKPGGALFNGSAPCFGSRWGLAYRDKIKYFFRKTGFDIWENDGPYPGDLCASVIHPGHKGVEDSQWRQMEIQKELYHWLNERGVYVNAPDWYFLDGTNKTGIGYREVNFSLSREQQRILNRQNIYDGTSEKSGSMSWGFVPLTKYQGGGPEAVLEPLSEHLKDYEQLMIQYYGAGVQACYRGPRLYDTEATRQLVSRTIGWYKKYREILNADMVHLRRADGRDWDGLLHVNPKLKQKGLVMLYNPTKQTMTRTIQLPLYYTGLSGNALLSERGGAPKPYRLNRKEEATLKFTIAPENYTWFVIE
ncbi:MAG: alpha-galactosidase [Flavitalea sp.]